MATQLNNWLSIDKTSGTGNAEITLTASSYSELVDRVASLKIQAQTTNAILNVRQKAYTPIEKNDNYFWVEFGGTNGTISGLTNDYTDMYHSFDGTTWLTTPNTLSMGSNKLVYFKNNSKKISDRYKKLNISFNSNAKVGGDISSITDMTDSACQNLFYNNEYLTDASELILPWNTLNQNCYNSMFFGCTSLTKAPVLPATTLALNCYESMFEGCTSLTKVFALPATTLAEYCYYRMFYGCTSLTTAFEILPATTLALYCYEDMFRGCTSLTTAPSLPATTLPKYCYEGMFWDCTSLTNAPELPATTLADRCYANMFENCTNLAIAPALPATTLAYDCYSDMFYKCTNLTTAPELPATTLADSCYTYMFYGCTNLNYVKMLATENITKDNLFAWLSGVANNGTFIKHPDANISRGISGIPSRWTVETATS